MHVDKVSCTYMTTGTGHLEMWFAIVASVRQNSVTVHESSRCNRSHQTHWNPVPRLAERQLEQSVPSCIQSYNVTVRGNIRVHVYVHSVCGIFILKKQFCSAKK